MDYLQLVETLSPDVYRNLLRSVELGRWPDGRPLTPEQRENAMQAIIAWGEMHLPEEERVGYINPRARSREDCAVPEETPLKWREQE